MWIRAKQFTLQLFSKRSELINPILHVVEVRKKGFHFWFFRDKYLQRESIFFKIIITSSQNYLQKFWKI